MQITLKENCGNTKNISFQFHYRKFSQQSYSTISYYYRHVTKGKRWGRSPLSFLKNWKKVPWFWGKLPIYGLFFQDLFFLCCRWNVYQNVLIPRKLPCSHKFLVTRLAYLRVTLRKNPFINSLVQHLKKIMNMLHASNFSFIILN